MLDDTGDPDGDQGPGTEPVRATVEGRALRVVPLSTDGESIGEVLEGAMVMSDVTIELSSNVDPETYRLLAGATLSVPAASYPTVPDDVAEAVRAFAETEAEQRYTDFLAKHSWRTCTERECNVCRELSEARADGVRAGRDNALAYVQDRLDSTFFNSPTGWTASVIKASVRELLCKAAALPAHKLWS